VFIEHTLLASWPFVTHTLPIASQPKRTERSSASTFADRALPQRSPSSPLGGVYEAVVKPILPAAFGPVHSRISSYKQTVGVSVSGGEAGRSRAQANAKPAAGALHYALPTWASRAAPSPVSRRHAATANSSASGTVHA
jgi:hypothetical protein